MTKILQFQEYKSDNCPNCGEKRIANELVRDKNLIYHKSKTHKCGKEYDLVIIKTQIEDLFQDVIDEIEDILEELNDENT